MPDKTVVQNLATHWKSDHINIRLFINTPMYWIVQQKELSKEGAGSEKKYTLKSGMNMFYVSENRYKFTICFWWIPVLQPQFNTHILPMTPKLPGLSSCLLTPASWLSSQRIVRSSSQYGCLSNCVVLNPGTDPLPTGPQKTPWKPQSFCILASSSWLWDYASLLNKQLSPPPHLS